MNRDPLDEARRWLATEGAEDSAAADAAFRQVFRLVPRHEPPAAFADRVVGTARGLRPIRVGTLWDVVWLRLLVSFALLLTGVAALGLFVASPVPDVPSLVSMWAGVVSRGAVRLRQLLDLGLSVWMMCSQVGEAARAVVATPPVRLGLFLNGALALVAICGLRRLLSPGEEKISW